MRKLVIVGVSKTAAHVYSFIKYHNLYDVIGFAVNESYKKESTFEGLNVYSLERLNEEVGNEDFSVFVAMLWNHLNRDRKLVYEYCKEHGYKMANVISPLSSIRSELTGDNCWVHDYVVIQQDALLGSDIAIMSGTLIGANTHIGSHCFFGARSVFGGGSSIGEQGFVGINSVVFDDTMIGRKCIIGACTAVKRNMPDFSKYVTPSDSIIIKQYTEDEVESKLVFSKNIR